MAEGVLHFDSPAYRAVVCFGFIVDEQGRKMSKSLGNVVDPLEVMQRYGADALRWVLLTSGSPWSSRRLGDTVLEEAIRQFLLTLWHVYSFFVLYANADGADPDAAPAPPLTSRPLLDRWILSRLAGTVRDVREGMDAYDVTGAGRRIQGFVDELSNWYVRRSRRRFWNPGGQGGEDSVAAFHTLHECLVTTATLLAPFTPFVAEELWSNLAAGARGTAGLGPPRRLPATSRGGDRSGSRRGDGCWPGRSSSSAGGSGPRPGRARGSRSPPRPCICRPTRDRSEPSSTSWRTS